MKSILSIILLIAAALLFFFFTKPKMVLLKQRQIEVKSFETALDNAKRLDARIKDLTDAQNSITQADRDKMKVMLPDNVENVRLIIDFDKMLQSVVEDRGTINLYKSAQGSVKKLAIESPRIAQSTGTQIGTNVESSKLGVAALSFSVNLTYGDFLEFIRRIEFSKRIMDIDSISFSAPESSEGPDPVYAFSISLKTYWLKYDASTNNIDKQ